MTLDLSRRGFLGVAATAAISPGALPSELAERALKRLLAYDGLTWLMTAELIRPGVYSIVQAWSDGRTTEEIAHGILACTRREGEILRADYVAQGKVPVSQYVDALLGGHCGIPVTVVR